MARGKVNMKLAEPLPAIPPELRQKFCEEHHLNRTAFYNLWNIKRTKSNDDLKLINKLLRLYKEYILESERHTEKIKTVVKQLSDIRCQDEDNVVVS